MWEVRFTPGTCALRRAIEEQRREKTLSTVYFHFRSSKFSNSGAFPLLLMWRSTAPASERPLRLRVRGCFSIEILIDRHLVHWKAPNVVHHLVDESH